MEKDKQIAMQSKNGNVALELYNAKKEIKIAENSIEEIENTLRFIFLVIGIHQNNLPQGYSRQVLIEFIKGRIFYLSLSELKLAFVYAVEKRIEVDLTLYGQPFSPKFLMDVTTAYIQYRNKNIAKDEPKESPMINNDRFANIIELLKQSNPETVNSIKEIGQTKETEKKKEKLPFHDFHQECMREFDKARNKESDKSGRFAIIDNAVYSLEEFINMKADELITNQNNEANDNKL